MTQGNEQIAAVLMSADSVRTSRTSSVVDTVVTHTPAVPATQDRPIGQRVAMDVLVGLVIGMMSAALSVAIVNTINGK